MIKRLSIRVSQELIGKIIRESRNFIADHFLSNLESLKVMCDGTKITTINIYQCDQLNDSKYLIESSFLDYYKLFDYEKYNHLTNNYDKKLFLFNYLLMAISDLCKLFNWEYEAFDLAYKKCLDEKFNFVRIFKNKVFDSPNKLYKFGLLYKVDFDEYCIFEVLYDKNKNELSRRLCFKDSAMVFLIESLGWIDNEFVFYKFKGPKKLFTVNINDILSNVKVVSLELSSEYFKDAK